MVLLTNNSFCTFIIDRSSVGRFHKQFEESKILLEDYIQTLRRCQRDKIVLMALLSGSEVFYEVAQEEAKVIVNVSKPSRVFLIYCSVTIIFNRNDR